MDPRVSIIIPVYGVERYIEKCIESIESQTYRDFEAIFVDDGSPDGSAAIIERHMKADGRIKLVRHGRNKGLFRARVTGVEHAVGEYITFIDSDDTISPNWIETLASRMEDSGADIVIGDLAIDNGEGKELYACDPIRLMDFDVTDDVLGFLMRQKGYFKGWSFVWNKMYSCDVLNRSLPKLREFCRVHGHTVMCEDIAFCFIVFSNARHLVNVHGAYYYYYLNEGSTTNATQLAVKFEKNVRDASHVFRFMGQNLESMGLYERYLDDFVMWRYRYGSKFENWLDQYVACMDDDRIRYRNYIVRNFGLRPDGNLMLDMFPYMSREPLDV